MLSLCIILFSFVNAHNWIHSRARSGGTASTLTPAPPKPTVRRPHLRVGQNQDFGVEFASGHSKSYYYFVVTHARHEDKLKEHTPDNLKQYVKEAPSSSQLKGQKWQKRHTSCGFSNMCSNKKGRNDGTAYLKQLQESDDLYFDRPDVWGNSGIAQFQYKSNDIKDDKRVSYTNKKWPWIETVHMFRVMQARPREWDIANFKIEGKEGPGEYIIHMVWNGYRDIIDVDVLPQDSVDIYGSPDEADSSWTRMDHCQYKPAHYSGKNSKCIVVDNNSRDVSKCLDMCQKINRKGKPKCTAVNVVPLKNPQGVNKGFDTVNIPDSRKCTGLKAASDDAVVCYGIKPKQNTKKNPQVDTLWTIINDDPEDPIFYSSCYNLQQGWTFQGYTASDEPQAKPISERVGDQCLECSDIDKINGLKVSQVPLWRTASECHKCSAR